MTNIEDAKNQARAIAAAINGESSAMQTLGNIGRDARPEVMLAVGLAHAQNAIGALIKEIEDLRAELALQKRR